jgi:hypothetical protein
MLSSRGSSDAPGRAARRGPWPRSTVLSHCLTAGRAQGRGSGPSFAWYAPEGTTRGLIKGSIYSVMQDDLVL